MGSKDIIQMSHIYDPEYYADWNIKILYNLANWKNGLAFRNINFSDNGKPVIKIAELKNGLTAQTKYTNDTFDSLVHLSKGDMVFSWSGNPLTSIDVFWYSLPDGWLNQHIFKITVKEGVSETFFFYLLKYLKPNFIAIATNKQTTGLGHVTIKDLKSIKVKVPSLLEQGAIAATLSCLDDKIELNNRINQTLDKMTQAIFKSWFVDFEPFQYGEFEDSELGRIPKGWKVLSIKDVTRESNTGGDAIKKTPMVDYNTGIKCVRVGDLANQRGFEGWGYSNVGKENFKKYQLKKNDIIVTRTATLGLNQIIDEDMMAVYNNGLIRIKLNEKVASLFFYQSINTADYNEYIGRIESESSTRPNMKMNYLLKYRFICPPIDIQEKYIGIIIKLRQQRATLFKQNVILSTIRDSLLPKLMSGEIQVPIEEV